MHEIAGDTAIATHTITFRRVQIQKKQSHHVNTRDLREPNINYLCEI